MQLLIKIISSIIVLLGIVHIGFAFPLHMNAETLWFTGAGMAIIFAGLLNFVALERSGSKFSKGIALIVNALMCGLFCLAIPILNEPQVYVGVAVFLSTTLSFAIDFANAKTTKS